MSKTVICMICGMDSTFVECCQIKTWPAGLRVDVCMRCAGKVQSAYAKKVHDGKYNGIHTRLTQP